MKSEMKTVQNPTLVLLSNETAPILETNKTKTKTQNVSPSSSQTKINSISAGENLSAAISEEGRLYVWGLSSSNQISQINQLGNIEFSNLSCGVKKILVVVGLANLPTIQFSSFNPPKVKAGTVTSLIDWLLSPKRCIPFNLFLSLLFNLFLSLLFNLFIPFI